MTLKSTLHEGAIPKVPLRLKQKEVQIFVFSHKLVFQIFEFFHKLAFQIFDFPTKKTS